MCVTCEVVEIAEDEDGAVRGADYSDRDVGVVWDDFG